MAIRISNKNAWIAYDFGNSAYVLIFLTFIFPILFENSFEDQGSSYWGFVVSLSTLLGVAASFWLGQRLDKGKSWQIFPFAMVSGLSGVVAYAFLGVSPFLAGAIFILSNACYVTTLPRYDSLLYKVESSKVKFVSLSTVGWGFGYAGGITAIIIGYLLVGGFPNTFEEYAFYLIPCSILYIVFSLPLSQLDRIPEPPQIKNGNEPVGKTWSIIAGLLCANEGIAVVQFFTAIFARTVLNLEISIIAALLLGTQVLAIPLTILMGKLAKKFGEPEILVASLVVWILVVVGLISSQNLFHLSIVAILTAFVIGSTQSIYRGMMAEIVPKTEIGLFYSFYGLATRAGSLVGPAIFGLIAYWFPDRIAFLSVIPFFLISIILILKYNR